MAKRSNVKVLPYALLTTLLIVADQWSKAWVIENLKPYTSKPLVGELLKTYLVWNDSAAFSIGFGITWIFTIISSVATLVILWLLLKTTSFAWRLTLAILLAGVVGNLIDRLFRAPGFPIGKVVDFLQIPFNFPIFNLADVFISGSMVAVVVLIMRGKKING